MPKVAKKRSSAVAQVWHFSVRFSLAEPSDDTKVADLLEDFKTAKQAALAAALKTEMGAKGRYIFQLEMTPRPGGVIDNWHYQCYLHRTEKERPRTLGARLGHTFRGISVQAASTAGKERLRSYVMKTDSRQAGPWADRPIIAPYNGQDLPAVWRPWQAQVIAEVTPECKDDRTINWIYDDQGGMGKNKLIKYLNWKRIAKYMSFESAANLNYQVLAAKEQRGYFFDLPRTKGKNSHMDDIYQALEQIKNGMVISGKYEGGELMMNPPHVWVLSNYLPDTSKMSPGRFKIWHCNKSDFTIYLPAPVVFPVAQPSAFDAP